MFILKEHLKYSSLLASKWSLKSLCKLTVMGTREGIYLVFLRVYIMFFSQLSRHYFNFIPGSGKIYIEGIHT